MTATLIQLNANKNNAKKSTGPRSISGKKKASLNSFKHGLSRDFVFDENQKEKIELLVNFIGRGRGEEYKNRAQELAEAQILLNYIRHLRSECYNLTHAEKQKNDLKSFNLNEQISLLDLRSDVFGDPITDPDFFHSIQDLEQIFSEMFFSSCVTSRLKALNKLTRYERVAQARRNRALKSFLDQRSN